MSVLTDVARAALRAGRLAHLVTVNPDASPQVSLVWVGLEGDDIVCAHLGEGRKLRNIERDARVALLIRPRAATRSASTTISSCTARPGSSREVARSCSSGWPRCTSARG